jgi:glycolate oxidase iron-sulfur subunit
MRRLIDAWWPHIEAGIEAVAFTASGCGVMLKDYAHVLAGDNNYREKAERIVALTRDLSAVLVAEGARLQALPRTSTPVPRVALHAPCTLQHGLHGQGAVADLLRGLGFALTPVPDAHLCCGSAGTYSIFQSTLSRQLRERKLGALESGRPQVILTANIGCLMHLDAASAVRVRHWIEAVDERLA